MEATVVIPVIAIDGPSASGKGTVAQRVADRLDYHYLDSGAIYRAAALAARRRGLRLDDPAREESRLAECAARMDLVFRSGTAWLDGEDVGAHLRTEECGKDASRIAALPELRAALLARQRGFRRPPGLVADGRDMASVVFPDAVLKVFLTASAAARAERRARQLGFVPEVAKGLIAKENSAKIRAPFEDAVATIQADLEERDRRDAARAAAPLKQAADARFLDTTEMSIEQAVDAVLGWFAAVASASRPGRGA